METLKSRIKRLCERQNKPLYKLEMEIGAARGYLSKVDKSAPSSETIAKIADALGVSTDYLLTGEREKFDVENAHLLSKIANDPKLLAALEVYFTLTEEQKGMVIFLINTLGEH